MISDHAWYTFMPVCDPAYWLDHEILARQTQI